jgi:hypothetical protein
MDSLCSLRTSGETIDPLYESVLNKRMMLAESVNSKIVKIDGEEVEINPNFKLFHYNQDR